MKDKIKTIAFTIAGLLLSTLAISQPVPFDDLIANVGTNGAYNKSITWLTSTYGNGIGHKIYSDDYSGQTYLKFAAKHSGQYNNGWKDMMTLTSLGKVGIGTSSPSVALSVAAEENQTGLGLNTLSAIRISNQYADAFGRRSELQFGMDQNPNSTLATIAAEYSAWSSDVGGDLVFGTNPTQSNSVVERMRITHDGTVFIKSKTRIGTLKPTGTHSDAMLAVDGKMVSKSMYVTQQNWADFVFDKDYNMPKLSEIETYYKTNGHLPLIPTAAEVKENGVDLGEMNKLLLQKVEELTILMVEQDKKMEAQSKRISDQEIKIQSLIKN